MTQAGSVQLPKRLPLLIGPENRASSTDKDSRLVNCYVEKDPDGDYQIYRRPCFVTYARPPAGNAAGRGVFFWQEGVSATNVFAVFGSTFYGLAGTTTTISLGISAARIVSFDSVLGATPWLVVGDQSTGYYYNAGSGLVQIVDADFPATFYPGWAYLNGTLYVAKAVSSNIQGSDINTPSSWSALNVIQAQIEPDALVALSRQLVYVICFKNWSTEVFYDAANATGSPLGRVEGAKLDYGCANGYSIQRLDDSILWLTANRSSLRQVALMRGLKSEIVSTPAIERLISSWDLSTVWSWQLMYNGHKFYGVTSKVSNMTLVYDLTTNMWSQWTDVNGNYLPFVSSTFVPSTTGASTTLLQHETDGYVYSLSLTAVADALVSASGPVPVEIYTPNFDAGTRRGKQLNMMYFNGDLVPGSILQVRYNDNDYQPTKWSNFRYVDLGQETPMLEQEGTFTRRAYHFRHKANTLFRLSSVDLQMDLCAL